MGKKNKVLSLETNDNIINFELNDKNYNHFKSLDPMHQLIIQQTMQLKYLESLIN